MGFSRLIIFLCAFRLAFLDPVVTVQTIITPQRPTVQVGQVVTMTCTATCPQGRPEWRRGFDASPFQVASNDHESKLTIPAAEPEDAGTYTCMTRCGEIIDSRTTEVFVFAFPDPVVYTVPTNPVSGQVFEVFCVLDGVYPPEVEMHLIRGEDALEGLEPDDTEGDFILYKFVLKADGQIGTGNTQYRCEAILTLNHHLHLRNTTLPIQFKAPPQNTSVSPAFIRGQAGHSASFSCRAPTESSLNISWVKEGSEGIWKPPRHWLQTPSPGRLQVDIEQLQVEDRGNYTCIISNDIGETRHTLTLLLSYGPRSVESSPREMTAREGEPLTLSCSGDASPPPAITWTKDDDSPPPSWKVGATQGRATLSTAALAPRDAGIYLCTIQNSIGSETRVVSLTVQCDPTTSSAPDATSPPVSDPERSTASAAFTGDVQTTREGVTTAVSESAIDSTEREPAEPKGSTSSHTESDRETESTQSTEKVTTKPMKTVSSQAKGDVAIHLPQATEILILEDVPPITTTYVLCTMGPVAGLSSLGLVIHLIRRMKKKSLLELPQ